MSPPLSPTSSAAQAAGDNDRILVYNASSPPSSPVAGTPPAATPPSPSTPVTTGSRQPDRQPAWFTLNWFENKPAVQTLKTPPQPHTTLGQEQQAVTALLQAQRDRQPGNWISANWFPETPPTQPDSQSPVAAVTRSEVEIAIAEQSQAHLEHCAIDFLHAVAAQGKTDKIVTALESALSIAFGSAVPSRFADRLECIKINAERSRDALRNAARFDPVKMRAREREPEAALPITQADLVEVASVAEFTQHIAVDCAQQLADFTKLADGAAPAPDAVSEHAVDLARMQGNLATIASPLFRDRLIDTLPLQARLQRHLQVAGETLLRAPEQAVEWLIPTLKNEQPALHQQQVERLKTTVQTIASTETSASNLREKIREVLQPKLLEDPVSETAADGTTASALEKQLRGVWNQTEAPYREIKAAAQTSSLLVARRPRSWRNLAQSERDIAAVASLRNRIAPAHTALEGLLTKARKVAQSDTPAPVQTHRHPSAQLQTMMSQLRRFFT